MRPSEPQRLRHARAFGWTASILVHLAVIVYVQTVARVETLDLELGLPDEVEFGVVEEVAMAAPTAPPGAEAPAQPSPARSPDLDDAAGAGPSSADAGVRTPQPEPEPEETPPRDAGLPEPGQGEPTTPTAPPTLEGPSRIPPGAQVAVRIDMARIRASVLAPDVRRLLDAIPDWYLLLDGSGIDPIEDLDRILIASPNLQRSRLVLAGRHARDAAYVRAAVARIAAARGGDAAWGTHDGVPVAPWESLDPTDRELAILDAHHYAITRPVDLPRLLAVMQARQERDAEAEGLEEARGPEALLSMGPDEGVSLEIEGVARFILRRPPGMPEPPERLRAAAREVDPRHAALESLMTFASEANAADAAEWLEALRARFVDDMIVRMSGMSGVLRDTTITTDGPRVHVETTLNDAQLRLIFSYIEGALTSRRRQLGLPPAPPRGAGTNPTGPAGTPASAGPPPASPGSPERTEGAAVPSAN